MNELKENLESVSGGNGSYDAGHAVGVFAADCLSVFIKMGNMYTPIL